MNNLQIASMRTAGNAIGATKNSAINKVFLESLGGLENVLVEDVNLGNRVRSSGKRVEWCPDAICYDQVPDRWSWYFRQQQRWMGGGLQECWRLMRTAEPLQWLLVGLSLPVFFAPALVLMLIFSVSLLSLSFSLCVALALIVFIAFLIFLVPIIRYGNGRDLLLFPISFVLLSIAQFAVLIVISSKILSKSKIEWHKTPKHNV